MVRPIKTRPENPYTKGKRVVWRDHPRTHRTGRSGNLLIVDALVHSDGRHTWTA